MPVFKVDQACQPHFGQVNDVLHTSRAGMTGF